jgi:hypothetical protein
LTGHCFFLKNSVEIANLSTEGRERVQENSGERNGTGITWPQKFSQKSAFPSRPKGASPERSKDVSFDVFFLLILRCSPDFLPALRGTIGCW